MDRITVVHGDTDLVPTGGGTMGSRSLQHGGAAVHQAAIELVDEGPRARRRAARGQRRRHRARQGRRRVPRRRHAGRAPRPGPSSSAAAAERAATRCDLAATVHRGRAPTFPFGAHVAVVEVDTETGQVRLLRHVAVRRRRARSSTRCSLEGQIHGGIAQGAAQALLEEVRYDEDGNPVTSNLADYAFISAAELPSFEVVHMETPTPVNPLGAKGIGESGTIGSTPAVQNAVVDAVAPPRRAPHRHARDARAGVAGDRRRPEVRT